MSKKYHKAYKEVIEILKYMSQEDIERIPNQMIKMFKEKMDKNHEFKYDESKKFAEQELLIETKAILANIFRDYWATPEQREKIKAKQNYDRKKSEEQKREKYNPENIFKKQNEIPNKENIEENTSMIQYKESAFNKIMNKIKRIFNMLKNKRID